MGNLKSVGWADANQPRSCDEDSGPSGIEQGGQLANAPEFGCYQIRRCRTERRRSEIRGDGLLTFPVPATEAA
jgi:hypothetical protein